MAKRKALDIEQEEVRNDCKSSKKRRNKRPKDIDDGDLDTQLGINHVFDRMSSRALINHIAQRTARFQPLHAASVVDEMGLHGM